MTNQETPAKACCRACLYVAEIPAAMTPAEYGRWHNWSLPFEAHKGILWSFCSQCHAQVPRQGGAA
jgi:hypothetical protein